MRLKKIEIELQNWGEFKGKYLGKITYEDGLCDSFQFGLTPDVCAKFLLPIAEQVISSSKELGTKLAQSFTKELEPSNELES